MSTYSLTISSPDGNLYKAPASSLILRGAEGELAILAGHVPFTTSVVPCTVRITTEGGEEKIGKTEGGILTVSPDGVVLLSGSFQFVE